MTNKLLMMTSALALVAGGAAAQEMNFNRIAAFATYLNNADAGVTSSSEIITASADGMTIAYSDSPAGVIGLIDITDPANPAPKGAITLNGEPTAVSALGNTIFAAVNTSASYTEPSGHLVQIDLADGAELGRCDLGGQPDSTAVAPDGSFVTIAIENERDEDLGEGRVPQMPAGYVAIVPLNADGQMDCAAMIKADVTGLADIAPEDPEPEFVDVNANGEIVVTLQENNHIVVLASDGTVRSHFSAGSVDLVGIDATDERAALIFDESQMAVPREPDAVQWIDADHIAIANEGDMDGGSRGFTVLHKDGTEIYESGVSFEHAVVQIGHYPDRRSDAKGVEPEGMEFARFGETPFLFLLAERASVVGVYDMTDPASPALRQMLPSGISPEGAVAIPARNLLVTANELDLVEDGGVRSHVMIYEYQAAPAVYPTVTSAGADQLIGWGALSGMVAGENGLVYAVNDSFYGYQPRIFTIDTTQTPARIIAATDITRAGYPAQKLDIEGIASDGKGGFWLASEGRSDRMIPHGIYNVNAKGEIKAEIAFPAALLAGETRFGAEGITQVGDTLWIAIQRNWADDAGNDVKLVSYNLETEDWGAVTYPVQDTDNGWIGLSEITAHGDHVYLIERDNQIGAAAAVKTITRVAIDQLVPAPLGGPLPVVEKELVRDLIPDLASYNGYIVDKVEGLAIFPNGQVWVATDNDGVDDSSGETFVWSFDLN